jgi:hypothetical protein
LDQKLRRQYELENGSEIEGPLVGENQEASEKLEIAPERLRGFSTWDGEGVEGKE